MKILKKLICKLFGLPIAEGNYTATVIDVSVKRLKPKRLSMVKIKFLLEDVETGKNFTHVETLIDDFDLICRSYLGWIFEIYRIYCVDYYDLIGSVFDVSIIHDCICGKKVPVVMCNDVLIPPCAFDEREVE